MMGEISHAEAAPEQEAAELAEAFLLLVRIYVARLAPQDLLQCNGK